jgi:hypothetical protein
LLIEVTTVRIEESLTGETGQNTELDEGTGQGFVHYHGKKYMYIHFGLKALREKYHLSKPK